MNINAIGRVDPIRTDWLHPLRTDWLHPVRTDRIYPGLVDTLAAPYPAEALRALALNRAERIARPSPVESSGLQSIRDQSPATRATVPVQDAGGAPDAETIDWLRNQFATHRLASAIQAFEDEQAANNDHAGAAAVNLGTSGHPLLINKYLVAFGNPPIEPLQPLAAAPAGPARVAAVAGVNAIRNATEDALGADPETRNRARRLGETVA